MPTFTLIKRRLPWQHFAALGAVFFTLAAAPGAVVIDYVVVGSPGNAGDPSNPTSGLGAVSTTFLMGKYEVTNAQYVEFLNAVDPAGQNTLSLYNTAMTTNVRGGITFVSGAVNGQKYEVKPGYTAMPVIRTSFYDAIRFTNWLQNGQGNGSTETGAYTLEGGSATPSNGTTVARNVDAGVWIPSENEWYKAAYYQPAGAGGDADSYWEYPSRSNIVPNSRPSNSVDANSANFFRNEGLDDGVNDGFAVSGTSTDPGTNTLTNVGSYTLASTYYGTFDQGGNVSEWLDTIPVSGTRGLRGGSAYDDQGYLDSFTPSFTRPPASDNTSWGFRVAAAYSVPEPSFWSLSALTAIGLATLRRKR